MNKDDVINNFEKDLQSRLADAYVTAQAEQSRLFKKIKVSEDLLSFTRSC